jgi:hypothetical protein
MSASPVVLSEKLEFCNDFKKIELIKIKSDMISETFSDDSPNPDSNRMRVQQKVGEEFQNGRNNEMRYLVKKSNPLFNLVDLNLNCEPTTNNDDGPAIMSITEVIQTQSVDA